jgi:hypothetical protein
MHLRRLGIDDADLCNGRDQSAASGDTGLVNDGGSSFRAMVNRQVRFKFSEWLPQRSCTPSTWEACALAGEANAAVSLRLQLRLPSKLSAPKISRIR